ncbi:enoyl-CoA hydratase/isomerase family protein [Paraburkholderia bannensis]|uniref:enoyl-CoA hydratase/isomerase family protein n=1 Tax=Paraburkholderia bannensis TaxID=765414 RepID=UPI002AB6BA63|nr:enoyl-CoA hydratase/isomerase family protein [Paraburkholderia bannensis]
MSEPTLLITRPHDGVLQLTLNRPKALNAVDTELAQALADVLTAAASDAHVRVLVLTGAGERAFSAGYDIREMATMDANAMLGAALRRCPVIHALARHPKPVIAALNGLAHGVGALYAMAADIRLASPGAQFRVAATLHNAAEGAWQLPQLVGAACAKEILMTGRVVCADEAVRIGLYHEIVAQDALLETALAKARDIAALPPLGVQWVKKLIDDNHGRTLDEQFHAEQLALATVMPPANGLATFAAFLGKGDTPDA